MRFSLDQFTLAAAVLATVASATPLSKRDKSFTIKQVSAHSRSGRKHGPAAKAYAYHRYGKLVSTHLHDAAVKAAVNAPTARKNYKTSQKTLKGSKASVKAADSSEVDADPTSDDNEYISPITVGGQPVNLQFDTGSSDLWVFSSELSSDQLGNHSFYDPSKSDTSNQLQDASWVISYGDGSGANGDVYTDTVSVGGATVVAQAVELASNISEQFITDYASDGILGLGFDSINSVTPPQKTFFTNVKASLAEPVFTADLFHNAPGTYDFGIIDSAKYIGDITYVPVNNTDGFWGVTSSGFAVGSSSNMTKKNIKAIVDTGTTLLLVPNDVLEAYYSQVKGAKNSKKDQGWIYPCTATLPDLYISVGNYNALIPGTGIAGDNVDEKSCYGNMQFSDPSDGPDAIYGDVFLKSSFVVFKFPDGGQPQIGFATKSGSSPGGTPSSSSGGDAPGSSLSSAPSGNPSSDGSDAGNGSGGNDETDGKAGEDDTSGNSG